MRTPDTAIASGRFQLFSGANAVSDPRGGMALFRIDTITGQVWRFDAEYLQGPKQREGVYAAAWSPLNEDSLAACHAACVITGRETGWYTNHWQTTNALRDALQKMWTPPLHR